MHVLLLVCFFLDGLRIFGWLWCVWRVGNVCVLISSGRLLSWVFRIWWMLVLWVPTKWLKRTLMLLFVVFVGVWWVWWETCKSGWLIG